MQLLQQIDAYWRAANYLSVGADLPLRQPAAARSRSAPRTSSACCSATGARRPGQNFIYTHLNRVINKYDLDMIYISGPGHGGPAVVSGTYLEGTYSEVYSNIGEDEAGLKRLFTQFSFPGGVPSHASAECPGSIHEGGELGYSLSHAFGAVFDNPGAHRGLRDRRRRGGNRSARDGLAFEQVSECGDRRRGAADTASERLQNRQSDACSRASPREELEQLLRGYGWTPHYRRGPRADAHARSHGGGAGSGGRANPRRFSRRARPRRTAAAAAAALADDRAHLAEGLDGSQGRRRQTDRGHLQGASSADHGSGHESRALAAARGVAAQLPARRSCSTAAAARSRSSRRSRPRASGAWGPIRTPTAACCCATCACRTSRIMRSRSPSRALPGIGATHVLGRVSCATS